MSIQSRNPTTGELLQSFEAMTPAEVGQRVDGCVAEQATWAKTAMDHRAEPMRRLGDLLEERADAMAEIAVREMGKLRVEAVAELKKCAWVCRHYAEHAAAYLEPRPLESDGSASYVRYDPLGVVLAIMPWNFPFWQVFRFAAPNLMAGNGVLLKHAPNVPQCALAIEAIVTEAGFPENLFRNLFTDVDTVAELIADRRIAAATLTGSERAGRAVGKAAGAAIKPVVLELGGSDPFIVLDGADLEKAADVATLSRCLNNGQSCVAAKRVIVVDSEHDAFVAAFQKRLSALRLGDPMASDTNIGPLARQDLRDVLHSQVQSLVAEGARLVLGGSIPDGQGYFYPPTLLVDIPRDSATARQETFGPVATVFRVKDSEEALQLANDTDFGLGASLWTNDPQLIQDMVPRIQAGGVFVNGIVKSDPRMPFGGIKNSGIGRELGSEGILEFVNAKTVWVA